VVECLLSIGKALGLILTITGRERRKDSLEATVEYLPGPEFSPQYHKKQNKTKKHRKKEEKSEQCVTKNFSHHIRLTCAPSFLRLALLCVLGLTSPYCWTLVSTFPLNK
jgi:hypothetical protein